MMMFSAATKVDLRGRPHDDLAARQSLAEVVVGIALDDESHAGRHERTEALAGRAIEGDADGVLGQTLRAPLFRDLAAGDGADHAVDVAQGNRAAYLFTLLDGRFAEVEQGGDVQRLVEAVILLRPGSSVRLPGRHRAGRGCC